MSAKYYQSLKNIAKSVRCRLRREAIAARLPYRDISSHSAVVVAPHPDDETFGAGGMIAMKKKAGVPVHVIFLTGGEASHASCCSIATNEIKRIRRSQAIEATARLGLNYDELVWLNLKDGKIPCEGQDGFNDAVINLANRIERMAPFEIYSPHPHDGLQDHEAACKIVQFAAKKSSVSFRIIYYTVWAWFNMPSIEFKLWGWKNGWLLDIRPIFKRKASAIQNYLNDTYAPCGAPYCGRLPESLISCVKKPNEVFFDGKINE
ncbi:PIG-L deacetylase family protein [Thermodesulfobacteriota bacterium]